MSEPFGRIQFRNTDICLDIHCNCGELTHIDGENSEYIMCGKCGQCYIANSRIQLVPLYSERVINTLKEEDAFRKSE